MVDDALFDYRVSVWSRPLLRAGWLNMALAAIIAGSMAFWQIGLSLGGSWGWGAVAAGAFAVISARIYCGLLTGVRVAEDHVELTLPLVRRIVSVDDIRSIALEHVPRANSVRVCVRRRGGGQSVGRLVFFWWPESAVREWLSALRAALARCNVVVKDG